MMQAQGHGVSPLNWLDLRDGDALSNTRQIKHHTECNYLGDDGMVVKY